MFVESTDHEAVFARRLRELRQAARLTQRDVALRMVMRGYNWHQTTCAKSEVGDRPAYIGEAMALAEILGVSITDLVTEPLTEDERELAEAQAALAGVASVVSDKEFRASEAQAELDVARAWLERASERVATLSAAVQKGRK